MGRQEKIAIREAELGPVIARADHWEGAIEVNMDIFYKLPPMVQEFVLCHEVCHLKHNEWDEARTNALAVRLFMGRATSEADRRERAEFLSYIDGNGGYSNFDFVGLLMSLGSLGSNIFYTIKARNAGWYSWDYATQKKNLKTMLTQAFEASRRTGKNSAAQLFWAQMVKYTNKDSDLEKFLGRKENSWVSLRIAAYEKKYGFKFDEVTPIDLKAFPLAMLAIGIAAGFVVYKIIKKVRK